MTDKKISELAHIGMQTADAGKKLADFIQKLEGGHEGKILLLIAAEKINEASKLINDRCEIELDGITSKNGNGALAD